MRHLSAVVLASTLLAAPPTLAGGGHGGSGVVGLDVHAQGGLVDVLLAVHEGGGLELRHTRSRDGGRTWSAQVVVPTGGAVHPPHRGSDPQVAASGERVAALWTLPGDSRFGSGPLAMALSGDGGRTWRAGPNPADDGSKDGHGYADLVVDASGRFHAVWLDARDGGQGLRASRSLDGGRSWEANRTIDRRTCECCWNALLPGERDLRVIYRDTDPRDLVVAGSGDGGATWSVLGAAGAFGWEFEGCPHVGGALARTPGGLHALSWTGKEEKAGLHVVRSGDGGRAWGAPKRIGSPAAHRGDLAASGRRLAAVWDEPTATGRRVFAAVSADEGGQWPVPQELSEAGVIASHPRVVAVDGGAFLVLWTEMREGGPAQWRWKRQEAAP